MNREDAVPGVRVQWLGRYKGTITSDPSLTELTKRQVSLGVPQTWVVDVTLDQPYCGNSFINVPPHSLEVVE